MKTIPDPAVGSLVWHWTVDPLQVTDDDDDEFWWSSKRLSLPPTTRLAVRACASHKWIRDTGRAGDRDGKSDEESYGESDGGSDYDSPTSNGEEEENAVSDENNGNGREITANQPLSRTQGDTE